MRVAVFGSTGGTGRRVVEAALAAGHDVTAFARTPSKLATQHPRLRVVRGDVLEAAAVAQTVENQDAVLSTLGPPAGTPPGTLISDGTRHIIAAMKRLGVRRLVLESGLMVGDGKGMNAFKRLMLSMYRARNRELCEDKRRTEGELMRSDLDWVIVRPPRLVDSPARGGIRSGVDLDVKLSRAVSHADVAGFMVRALVDDAHLRQVVTISA